MTITNYQCDNYQCDNYQLAATGYRHIVTSKIATSNLPIPIIPEAAESEGDGTDGACKVFIAEARQFGNTIDPTVSAGEAQFQESGKIDFDTYLGGQCENAIGSDGFAFFAQAGFSPADAEVRVKMYDFL